MLILDAFATRYGWTYDQVLDTPQRILDSLPKVWEIRSDVAERRQAAEKAKEKAKSSVRGGRFRG